MIRILLLATLVLTSNAQTAGAESPTAIVEVVSPGIHQVRRMDYLVVGRSIKLGAHGKLVLGYLASCIRETVTGGTIVVGELESRGKGAVIIRERVECNGGELSLSIEQAREATGLVFREPPRALSGSGQALQ